MTTHVFIEGSESEVSDIELDGAGLDVCIQHGGLSIIVSLPDADGDPVFIDYSWDIVQSGALLIEPVDEDGCAGSVGHYPSTQWGSSEDEDEEWEENEDED